jgi:hypothetical protein
MSSNLEVRWRHRASECDPALWRAGFLAPLEGRWWYEALEGGGLEAQFQFLYAEVYDSSDRAVALAPAFRMEVPLEMFVPEPLVPILRPLGRLFPALLRQRTLFFGSPCSDRGWVGILPDCTAQQRQEIVAALDRAGAEMARRMCAPMRVWKDFPEEFRPLLDPLLRTRRLFRLVSFPGTFAALPDSDQEAYLLAMKPSRRQQLRRKFRRSHAAVDLLCELIEQPSPELLEALFSLFWQTYERATTRFERLNLQVFAQLARAPTTRFIVLREPASAAPVAFMLVYLDGPILTNKFIGIDYQRPKEWLLYFRLWEAAVDLALRLGHTGIESGQTGYRAKIATGHQMIPLWNWCHHRNRMLHWIYAQVGAQISWASLDPELAGSEEEADPAEAPATPQIHGNP